MRMYLFLILYRNFDFIRISKYLEGWFFIIYLYILTDVSSNGEVKQSRSHVTWLVKLLNNEEKNKEQKIVKGLK